ncbi:hypothetical protein [Rhizobium sp. NLR17b]|uniref:hypothetical protein n=1 Tax=Rhizobium sp. NLR17b TaxID=2731114 RepID=UPI002180ABB7|nr:hypothetical protein [Rhizobium sp. NLR17b]
MGSKSSCGCAGLRFLRGFERIGASLSRRSGFDLGGFDLGGFVMPEVQHKKLKNIATF